jgi:hypothetical protein
VYNLCVPILSYAYKSLSHTKGSALVLFENKVLSSIFEPKRQKVHVRWGPCPHSMARPRVADGGTASSYGG